MNHTQISRRALLQLFGAGVASLALSACGTQQPATDAATTAAATTAPATTTAATTAAAEGPVAVRVGSLTGPTTIGLVDFMERAKAGQTTNSFEFTIGKTADEILPLLIKGDLDIALIPANAGAVVYNKTKGATQFLNVNTLGVLYVVTGDAALSDFAGLAGKTVLMTGKSQTPEYVVAHLLKAAGIADAVTLEFKDTPDEVVSALSADPTATAVLPQPAATAACAKVEGLTAPISLTDVWAQYESTGLVTGATVARKDFIEAHPEALKEFISGQKSSVNWVNANPEAAAPLVVDAGIIPAAPIATKAIPLCNLVCVEGAESKDMLKGYFDVLYAADPSSVGGALPGDDAYYQG